MKLLIISAGPGMDEIRDIYGHAIDWISSFLNGKSLDISINHIYKNENFNHSEYDAWIITGSASSVLDNNQWISTLKDKIIYYKKNIGISYKIAKESNKFFMKNHQSKVRIKQFKKILKSIKV